MAKKETKIKVHEHKHEAKGKSQFDIWIDENCHLDINNVEGFISIHDASDEAWEQAKKIIKQYKSF
jgi:hypothetical protein